MAISERLLQFIWQFQYFNGNELTTTSGERVGIIHPGQFNKNQGPDFLDARILVGETTWAGTVELHIKASDWDQHGHRRDPNYENVVLHVVWIDDGPAGVEPDIPVVELQSRVAHLLLARYEAIMRSTSFLPCAGNLSDLPGLTWTSWKDRLLAERLTRKTTQIQAALVATNFHWEEVFWWQLARNFGMKVNAEAFETMAKSISLTIIAKHKTQIHQLEALLFGQAGLLHGRYHEDYPAMLQREYRFLRRKYGLRPIQFPMYLLRMRPVNFPTIRLAQLAMLVLQSKHLFTTVKELGEVRDIRNLFDVTANDYWHYHYRFDEKSAFIQKRTGATMIDSIMINTVAPMLFAYGTYHREDKFREKAVRCLEETPYEQNSISSGFAALQVPVRSSWDSQALLELKTHYCNQYRCLDCAIGNAILKGK